LKAEVQRGTITSHVTSKLWLIPKQKKRKQKGGVTDRAMAGSRDGTGRDGDERSAHTPKLHRVSSGLLDFNRVVIPIDKCIHPILSPRHNKRPIHTHYTHITDGFSERCQASTIKKTHAHGRNRLSPLSLLSFNLLDCTRNREARNFGGCRHAAVVPAAVPGPVLPAGVLQRRSIGQTLEEK
jgi:hypothetical protein